MPPPGGDRRPTGKGAPARQDHKCPVIALKQIEMGAVGVCVQKVSEAEAMVYGGDPTVNLYDWYVCIRNNRVEQVWLITARGAVY